MGFFSFTSDSERLCTPWAMSTLTQPSRPWDEKTDCDKLNLQSQYSQLVWMP